jgi:branched-chain amino acid transport system substrate-binding protein
VIVTSMWGGMYVSFYKQGVSHGMFRRARLAGNINFGVVPQAIGKDHPEGALAGVHSNYHFTYTSPGASPPTSGSSTRTCKRWGEYPSYAAEAAYTGLYLFKNRRRAGQQAGWGRVARR